MFEEKGVSHVPTIKEFPEIDMEMLINKYGPEGLYDLANLFMKRADKDVSDSIE